MSKLDDARAILRMLGLPPEQHNEVAAYALLALANVRPRTNWSAAIGPMLRVHDILTILREHHDKPYAENSRETFRRKVLHQFEQARIVDRNPDDRARPVNSGKTCYALTVEALEVIRAYGTDDFTPLLAAFQASHPTLLKMYRAERVKNLVEIVLPDGVKTYLSAGAHNELQAAVIREFWPRFIPDAQLLYMGDTANKSHFVEVGGLEEVGLPFSSHAKLSDLVFVRPAQRWLILIEAVTSHGPCSPKRRQELEAMLAGNPRHRIYVSAFPSRREFKRHMDDIAWETEVWLADTPDHMIHYNGDKFLGPASGE